MRFLYTSSIYLYVFAIRIVSPFNAKAKLWLRGRKNMFDALALKMNELKDARLIWFHCASLGEFEQGRPLMEKIKTQDPSIKILLTFFSPSGYEIRKNYAGADFVFYLPLDTPKNAKQFIELVHPQKVFFVKYEFWFNYLIELKNKNIPTYLISGIFRENHHFFKWTGGWFRKQLNAFTHFFLQDENSKSLLNSIGYKNVTVAGDTRFDRVAAVAKNVKSIPLVEKFIGNNKVIILGSSWREDEGLMADDRLQIAEDRLQIAEGRFQIAEGKLQITDDRLQIADSRLQIAEDRLQIENSKNNFSDFKIIIAPHEIDEKHIAGIEMQFNVLGKKMKCVRYSQAVENTINEANILIIDNIGMLSSLYQYGTIAFIGGGFGKGIHNILEAAAFGLPVIFGPNYQKFAEATELIKLGGGFSIHDVNELNKTMQLLNDEQVLKTASHIAKMYVQSRVGASDKIMNVVEGSR
jgi:3-deoxy-D-manno-octulosonic-acid transferase